MLQTQMVSDGYLGHLMLMIPITISNMNHRHSKHVQKSVHQYQLLQARTIHNLTYATATTFPIMIYVVNAYQIQSIITI